MLKERIKEVRKALKLSQEEFGKALGVTKSSISNMESGRFNATDTIIKLICREFNVNENWLRTGEGEMFVEISEDEQLADFFGKIQNSDESDSIKLLMKTIAKLDDEGLQKVRDFIEIFMQKK